MFFYYLTAYCPEHVRYLILLFTFFRPQGFYTLFCWEACGLLFGFASACVSSGEGDGRLFQGQENDTNINTGQATVPLGSGSTHSNRWCARSRSIGALDTHMYANTPSPWMAAFRLPNVGAFGNNALLCVTEKSEIQKGKFITCFDRSRDTFSSNHVMLNGLASNPAMMLKSSSKLLWRSRRWVSCLENAICCVLSCFFLKELRRGREAARIFQGGQGLTW